MTKHRFVTHIHSVYAIIYIFDKNRFSDDQIAEYYGNVRNKYIKVMGFDYDNVKFDEIGSEMKIETGASVRAYFSCYIVDFMCLPYQDFILKISISLK